MKGTFLFMVVSPVLTAQDWHLGLRSRSMCDAGHKICDWYRATVLRFARVRSRKIPGM
jgi:hypothetical protein